ncbi:hypothetical protein KFL_002280180 [Klebsormidium nitens]|uniref:DNA primase/polymerase bifunctional N-terminal domain-containing protein n=1 Tax=Klebsormidium nitens TaxID=105231 RepID=A0A1Y1I481_KLENI|nr:hypothetical protein KFL_002280180 [Klebsormidium nitens]|eukprot:GAQ85303.1 hypothetical protein KFL_002280180 [Klebsormidium nitens]
MHISKIQRQWERSINQAMKEKRDANGLAILAGVSGVYVLDIDVAAKGGKRPGTELWQQLVEIHGEPETLNARTGSGGLHLYFKLDSPGLKWRRNFQGLKVDDKTFGVDGRGIGGVVFASPTSYLNAHGKLATYYEWINGPPSYEACQVMPIWLAELVNNHAGHSTGAATIDEEEGGEVSGARIDATMPGRVESPSFKQDRSSPSLEPPHGRELLMAELSKLLSEKAGDSTSTYAGSLPHGLYGTYYCYRTHGPRRCFFGHMHSGSNNFNLLKRELHVYYRCHGDECSHKPVKKLGVLENLKAALQDATADPVDPHDDMRVVTQYTRGTRDVQDLLLKIVIEHAAPQAYAYLGRLFAYMYLIEGRILVTTNEAERSRDQLFFVWDGTSWVQDTSNLVSSVFTCQMGCLLAWFDRQRERCLGTLYASRSELEGFVVDGVPKPLDPNLVNPKQMRKIRMAMETPDFPSDDTALIRRLVLLMFNYTFKNPHELDATNKMHRPIDVTLKPYFESDEGAADTLDFCVQGAIMYYAKRALAPASKVLSPVPEEFSAAVREYASENDKLQFFIDEACTTKETAEGEAASVTRIEFVEAFTNFLYSSGHDVALAGDGLTRAMRLKGFPQERGKAILIRTIDGKKRLRGFFGIRLKTKEELGRTDAQGNLP